VVYLELFLENKEHLLFELDHIICALSEYRDAISTDDREELRALLRDGREAKEKIDG
jgi:prephenate dehydrogenase